MEFSQTYWVNFVDSDVDKNLAKASLQWFSDTDIEEKKDWRAGCERNQMNTLSCGRRKSYWPKGRHKRGIKAVVKEDLKRVGVREEASEHRVSWKQMMPEEKHPKEKEVER